MNTEYWDAQIRGYEEAFQKREKLKLQIYWEEE
jgi:hypothetical protein